MPKSTNERNLSEIIKLTNDKYNIPYTNDTEIITNLNLLLKKLYKNLREYIAQYVKSENEEHEIFYFTMREIHTVKNLTEIQKASVVETYRAMLFLINFNFYPSAQRDWPILAQLQIKIYSLQAHIQSLTVLDHEAAEILNNFFSASLSIFPKDINYDELITLDIMTCKGSTWYNQYIYEQRKAVIESELESDLALNPLSIENYAKTLASLLKSTTNTADHFIFIDVVWNSFGIHQKYDNKNFAIEFIELLAQYAKNNVSAASKWIVTAARHGIFIFDEEFKHYTNTDLLFFILKAGYHFDHYSDYINDFFENFIERIINEPSDLEIKYVINELAKNFDDNYFALSPFYKILINNLEEKNPTSIITNLYLKSIKLLMELIPDPDSNPILYNSKNIKEALHSYLVKGYGCTPEKDQLYYLSQLSAIKCLKLLLQVEDFSPPPAILIQQAGRIGYYLANTNLSYKEAHILTTHESSKLRYMLFLMLSGDPGSLSALPPELLINVLAYLTPNNFERLKSNEISHTLSELSKQCTPTKHSFFNKYVPESMLLKKDLIECRHQSPKQQNEYDKHFALVLK